MPKSTFSARAAAEYLGFASSNTILTAIRNGELDATRRSGTSRNGRDTSRYLIARDTLEQWAESRGIEREGFAPVEGTGVLTRESANGTEYLIPERPQPAERPQHATNEQGEDVEVFNVSRVVPIHRCSEAWIARAVGGETMLRAARLILAKPMSATAWELLGLVIGAEPAAAQSEPTPIVAEPAAPARARR